MSQNWDIRFENGENILFYPSEVSLKFLNRYIKKRIGFDKFESILAAQGGGYKRDLTLAADLADKAC